MKPYIPIGVYILLCILTYYWLYNVINFDFITNENFADNTLSNSYFDVAKIESPYYIIDSTNYKCLTLSDDNKSVSMEPYPNNNNSKQLWIPVLDGNKLIKSPPNNDPSCNKITQNAISYLPKQFLIKSFHNKKLYLHANYNNVLNVFQFNLVAYKDIYTNRKADNRESPIFTGEINDRTQCTGTKVKCLTCTSCTQYDRELTGYRCVRWPRIDRVRRSTRGSENQTASLDCGRATIESGTRSYGFLWRYPSQPIPGGCINRNSCSWAFTNGSWGWDPWYGRVKNWNVSYQCSGVNPDTGGGCLQYEPVYSEFCKKCKKFTGKYNPKTCVDHTTNLPNIRRYQFENNRLTLVNKINIANDSKFNSSAQYVSINNLNNLTITMNNTTNFYFVPKEHRASFYDQYLIRNNLIPRNIALQKEITKDVLNYRNAN